MKLALIWRLERKYNELCKSRFNELEQIKMQIGDVPIDKFFSPAFMREYTTLPDIEALFTRLGYRADSLEELYKLCAENTDKIVKEASEFTTWPEMACTACNYYIANNFK